MEGYIQALIDKHYRNIERLSENQKLNQSYEINFINELEDLMEFYKKQKVEVQE